MILHLLAPAGGEVLPLAHVPDPVFSAGLVGSGYAIFPHADTLSILAPTAGEIKKCQEHAFVMGKGDIQLILHLGIDTYALEGDGFTHYVQTGATVAAAEPLAEWDTRPAQDKHLCTCVILTILAPGKNLSIHKTCSNQVVAGEPFFDVEI